MVQSLHAIRGDFNSALLTASVNMALVLVKIRPIVLFVPRSTKHGAFGGDSIILNFQIKASITGNWPTLMFDHALPVLHKWGRRVQRILLVAILGQSYKSPKKQTVRSTCSNLWWQKERRSWCHKTYENLYIHRPTSHGCKVTQSNPRYSALLSRKQSLVMSHIAAHLYRIQYKHNDD